MKKFIFEEKFISYANVEIYAENEEDARLQFQNGNYQYYDISDFTDGHELIGVRRKFVTVKLVSHLLVVLLPVMTIIVV